MFLHSLWRLNIIELVSKVSLSIESSRFVTKPQILIPQKSSFPSTLFCHDVHRHPSLTMKSALFFPSARGVTRNCRVSSSPASGRLLTCTPVQIPQMLSLPSESNTCIHLLAHCRPCSPQRPLCSAPLGGSVSACWQRQ